MGNHGSQSASLGLSLENNISLSWRKVTDCQFPTREGQCACGHGNNMYVFGGVIQHQNGHVESNDLLCFDGVMCKWRLVEAKGTLPEPRSSASLVCVGDKLYLFGGLSQEFGWFDKMHVFDIEKSCWSELQCEGTRPSARDKLQGTVVDNCIYYFGGFGPKFAGVDEEWEDLDEDDDDVLEEERHQQAAQFGWFNDLFVFDTATNKWSQPMHMNLGVPTARAAHGMCTVGRNIVIFGGRDTEKRTNDLHIFNVDTRKWDLDATYTGQWPASRSFHTCTAVGHRVVVTGGRSQDNSHFGDLHIFDTETRQWLQPKASGDLPGARGQHSMAVAGNQLVLFGGSSEFSAETMTCQKFYVDTYVLPIEQILTGSAFSTTKTKYDAKHTIQ